MSTHIPGFQTFFRFFHHSVLAKLATSSIKVETDLLHWYRKGALVASHGKEMFFVMDQYQVGNETVVGFI